MKFTSTKENLLFGVTAVQKAVSSKSTLPILSCIKLEVKGSLLYLSATDLELGIQCHVPVDVISEGVTIVPAKHFTEIVRKLPDTVITLTLEAENSLNIQYENSQLTLKTFPPDDFPLLPEIKGEYEFSIACPVIKQMIKQSVFAAGTDEGRPLFTGILCEVAEGKLRLIATDTHRLALRQGILQTVPDKENSFIVPAKMLSELARQMIDEDEICFINVTKNLASFTLSNVRIICRLVEGQFPNYRQVIPQQYKTIIRSKAKSLQEAIERISLFTMANDNSHTIHVKLENNVMTISSQSEVGQGYEQVNIELEGEPVIISFNARYLLDVFKIIDAEIISFEFTGALSPGIIRPAESDNFLYLVLPVRS